jgi:MYXO-CTERM domain-containing protein
LWFFSALGLVALGAASTLVGGAAETVRDVRSGSPGYRQSRNGQHQHWRRPGLTVYLDSTLQRMGPAASDAVMQAFGHWVASAPNLPNLAFDTGATSSLSKQDGLSTVSYGRIDVPGHERDLAITITYANAENGEVLEADIIINSIYPVGVLTAKQRTVRSTDDRSGRDSAGHQSHGADEADDCKDRYDLQNIVTHEAGHFFGLGEDPVERDATMFQTIDQCETHKRALSATDVGAVSALYAESAPPDETAAVAGAQACSVTVPGGHGAWGWLPSGLLVLVARRRRRSSDRC